jgi:hypothetical protein
MNAIIIGGVAIILIITVLVILYFAGVFDGISPSTPAPNPPAPNANAPPAPNTPAPNVPPAPDTTVPPPEPAEDWGAEKWSCVKYENDYIPIRRNRNKEIECLSLNNRDCLSALGNTECDLMSSSPLGGIQPLTCGEGHSREWGSPGYATAGHWCEKGRSQLGRSPNSEPVNYTNVKWSCVQDSGGFYIPIRLNNLGDIECLSLNHKNCLRVKGSTECNSMASSPIGGVKPLACGGMHQREWGNPGYGNSDHWCAKGSTKLP